MILVSLNIFIRCRCTHAITWNTKSVRVLCLFRDRQVNMWVGNVNYQLEFATKCYPCTQLGIVPLNSTYTVTPAMMFHFNLRHITLILNGYLSNISCSPLPFGLLSRYVPVPMWPDNRGWTVIHLKFYLCNSKVVPVTNIADVVRSTLTEVEIVLRISTQL